MYHYRGSILLIFMVKRLFLKLFQRRMRLQICNAAYTITMHHELLLHRDFIQKELEKKLSPKERAQLYTYHIDRVRDFQHERLVHLLVTFFFGFLLIGAATALLVQPLPELRVPLGFLSAILLVLELAYIRHYYELENGVQSLYLLTKRLQGV